MDPRIGALISPPLHHSGLGPQPIEESVQCTFDEERCEGRERCHGDFTGCAREVLNGGLGQEVPMLSDDDAIAFFKQAYCSSPMNYAQSEWMPVPLSPEVELLFLPVR